MRKEKYLTKENSEYKIKSWLDEINKIKSHKPFQINPNLENCALIVLDIQNIFLLPESHAFIPTANIIIPNIQKLVNKFNKSGRKIFFTKHITNLDKNDNMQKWWGEPIRKDNKFSEISSKLSRIKKNKIIIKNQYSAFFETNLEEMLHELNIKQLIITGVMSHLCCETTARDAFMRGFEVFFIIDAVATYTEKLHLGTLRALSHGFAICTTTREILKI